MFKSDGLGVVICPDLTDSVSTTISCLFLTSAAAPPFSTWAFLPFLPPAAKAIEERRKKEEGRAFLPR